MRALRRLRQGIPPSARRPFKWDALAGLLVGLFSGGMFPFLGVIAREQLHASAYAIGLFGVSGSVGNLFSPLVAHHARNRAKLPYVVWPFAIGRSLFLLMAVAVTAPIYIAITFLGQAVAALGSPPYAAVIRDAYPVHRRGYLMGLVRVLVVASSMLGALAAGQVLAHVSYRWVFPAATVLGLLSVVAFARIGVPAAPEEPAPAGARLWDSFRVIRSDRAFRLYATCFYLYGFGNLISGPMVPLIQVDELRITPQWVGYLATTSSAFSMIGYLHWGRFLDRHGPFRMMLFVYAVISVYALTYCFAHSVPVLLVASAAAGLAWSGGDLGYVNAAMRFGTRESATAYASVFAFLQACRGIPAPFIGAALSNVPFIGPRGVFLVSLGCWAGAAVVMVARGGLRLKTEGGTFAAPP
jgi:MFS family permease